MDIAASGKYVSIGTIGFVSQPTDKINVLLKHDTVILSRGIECALNQ